jgi:hypothetical protein
MKTLANYGNPFQNPLHGACSSFYLSRYGSNNCSETRQWHVRTLYIFVDFPAFNEEWKLEKIAEKESRNRKSDAAFGTIFRIS